MVSSFSTQIEAIGGEPMKTKIITDGKRVVVPDYARVQGILVGIVAAYILFFIIIGPECVTASPQAFTVATLSNMILTYE